MYKQVILVRKDLRMSNGKLASQCSHASVEAVLKCKDSIIEKWRKEGSKKVVLAVKNKTELLDYKYKADKLKLVNALISDAGRTQLPIGTTTCLAIGPDLEEKIDNLTGNLLVY